MHILIFIPKILHKQDPGYLQGIFLHDKANDLQKFYIVGTVHENCLRVNKSQHTVIGFYSSSETEFDFSNVQLSNWMKLSLEPQNDSYKYSLKNVYIDNQRVDLGSVCTMLIIYDQTSIKKAELSRTQCSGELLYR